MNRYYGLTEAVTREIESEWLKTLQKSADQDYINKNGDQYLHQGTAERVIVYLRDTESQHTSDFIIRRHLQNNYLHLLQEAKKESGKEYVDLNANKNLPWDSEFNEKLAMILSKCMLNNITKKQWETYLNSHSRIQRNNLFKLALTLNMDVSTTQKLLMACGKEPYNMHSVKDVINWYCQKNDKTNAYTHAQDLYSKYEKKVCDKSEGATEEEKAFLEDKAISGISGITSIAYNLIYDEVNDETFIEELARYSEEFTGYSERLLSIYYQFARYLAILYNSYDYSFKYIEAYETKDSKRTYHEQEIKKSLKEKDREIMFEDIDAGKTSVKKTTVPDMNDLLTSMFYNAVWFSGNKPHGKTDKHIAKVQMDTAGLIQTFCHNYKERCAKIIKNERAVDREDVLLFSFFFISHFLYLSAEKRDRLRTGFDEISKENTKLDRALSEVRIILDQKINMKEAPFETVIKCLNHVLNSFGFVETYLPNPFDRFIVLALLSSDPLVISADILEHIEIERENGIMEKRV